MTNRTATPAISNRGDGEFGADVKWGVTQSYVADFTYNTDFAQVEDDEQQVNLTRFSLLFPEKREFFMEGSQFFSFGIPGGNSNGNPDMPRIFFSRRIGLENGGVVPIVGGGRLLGRSGPYRVGVLTMRTGDVPALNAVATDFSVVRVQREFLRRSRIGVIGTRRAPSSIGTGTYNYAYGADAVLQFYENIRFTEYIAKTDTPGRTGSDLSYRSQFGWNPDRWSIDVEHLFAGKDFNPEVGYVRRLEGFRRTHGKFEFSPRPKNIPGVRKLFVSALVQYQSRTDSISTNARFRWEYQPGSELFIVYTDGRTTLSRGVLDLQNRSFVVKVTRLFQL